VEFPKSDLSLSLFRGACIHFHLSFHLPFNLRQVQQQGGNGAVAKELSGGDSFGELALLHGAAREANFVAKTPCTLWVLHRDAYRVCVMRATEARRTRYKDFLRGVSCLRAMSDYDCLALADASEEVEVPLGETACIQVRPNGRCQLGYKLRCGARK